ncbi:MAG: pit accessory protein [Tahibacter sp.]
MFSLQTIFGKGDMFYGLLEASAAAARQSAIALRDLLAQKSIAGNSLEEFRHARQREKEASARISQALVNTFVTALEREDIEALASALYKIPKVIEKFAERYLLIGDRLGDVDFVSRAAMLEKSCEVVEQMVGQLRAMKIEQMKNLNDRLQLIESEADRLILELYRELYRNETDPVRFLLRKDMFEILEKAIDRCRDAGNVVYSIVLKNS